jgi:hypothetical protein
MLVFFGGAPKLPGTIIFQIHAKVCIASFIENPRDVYNVIQREFIENIFSQGHQRPLEKSQMLIGQLQIATVLLIFLDKVCGFNRKYFFRVRGTFEMTLDHLLKLFFPAVDWNSPCGVSECFC